MLKSMTGYGASSFSDDDITIDVEIKTLNSKFLDLNLRIPKAFSPQEPELRNIIAERLQRGKVSMSIDCIKHRETELKQHYNEDLFVKYYQVLKKLSDRVISSDNDLFKLALNAPDVIINESTEEIDVTLFEKIKSVFVEALEKCDRFRAKEGAEIQMKFENYIKSIGDQLKAVEKLDPLRIEKIRNRIKGNLSQFVEEENIDKNRLEQELIYYIEKLDITEEKVRLKSHLDHFSEVLAAPDSLGKKLGFISQELGREINTIGSKANDADVQKCVVAMKEELEKIKEQVLNIL